MAPAGVGRPTLSIRKVHLALAKISPSAWIVAGGFLLTVLGISLRWYTTDYGVQGLIATNGWHYGLAVVAFHLTLGAAALALIGAFAPSFFPTGRAIMVLGGLAVVFVLIRIVDKTTGLPGMSGVMAGPYGVGIFLAFVGAAIVTLGGFVEARWPI